MPKITVNGVTYESVDDMPPEARGLYYQAMANLPDLADRDGDGLPDLVQGESLTVRNGVTFCKKIVVNGTKYDDEKDMPPDVRQAYEKAMSAMRTGEPSVKKNITMSFNVGGPGVSLRTSTVTAAAHPTQGAAGPVSSSQPSAGTPSPIEPASSGGGLRLALILGICAAGGLVVWLLMRAH